MKKPLAANTPIDERRFKRWTDVFGSYRSAVTKRTCENWLDQFDPPDRDLAARTLDSVLFYGQDEIADTFRAMLNSLDGWCKDKNRRTGRWFFVAMSSSAGESGDGMIYQFRLANNLDTKAYNEMFIYPRELVSKKLTHDDTVVLLDDFTGTGQQVCEAWNNPELSYSELVAGAGRVYLMVIAATKRARDRIREETAISLSSAHYLGEQDNVFSEKCKHFSKAEKGRLLMYNQRADYSNPKGRGDSGLLVVFCHRCPNNTIPIMHMQNDRWVGLFPRHE